MTSSTTSTEAARRRLLLERLSLAAVILLGCLLITDISGWHVTSSVVVLWIGWFSLVVTAKLMWAALWAVASDSDEDDADRSRELDESHRGDLLREKRSLLRSIKDVEFDRDMGKMSEAEAGQILRVYRARAIEIIKELDSHEAGANAVVEGLSADEAVERELAARLGATGTRGAGPARVQRLEELERRDAPMYQMAGGLFLVGLGTFVTLATYKAAAGGGMYVMWYGPIVAGIAMFARGFYGWRTLDDRPAAEAKPKPKPAPEPAKGEEDSQ